MTYADCFPEAFPEGFPEGFPEVPGNLPGSLPGSFRKPSRKPSRRFPTRPPVNSIPHDDPPLSPTTRNLTPMSSTPPNSRFEGHWLSQVPDPSIVGEPSSVVKIFHKLKIHKTPSEFIINQARPAHGSIYEQLLNCFRKKC